MISEQSPICFIPLHHHLDNHPSAKRLSDNQIVSRSQNAAFIPTRTPLDSRLASADQTPLKIDPGTSIPARAPNTAPENSCSEA